MTGTTETGWLIELRNNVTGKPSWLRALFEDDEWTTDATAALRFARKKDADAVIAEIGWSEAVATEHVWMS